MLRAIYGTFYNAKKKPENQYRKLIWVGYISGKRESRRLVGDYIYNQTTGITTPFKEEIIDEIPWTVIEVIVVALAIISIIVYFYKKGYF